MAFRYGPGDGRKYYQQQWAVRQARRARADRYKELRDKEKELDRRLTEARRNKEAETTAAKERAKALAAKAKGTYTPHVYISASVLRRWNMTRAQAHDILDAQGWTCPICHVPYVKPPVGDHDHATGKFRNFICSLCNTAMGMLQDDPDVAGRLRAYLALHGKPPQEEE